MADLRQVGSLWTPEEDVTLLQHVARYGTKHWGSLQNNGVLPHRDQKACCNRFILLKRKFFQARAKGQNLQTIFPYINAGSQKNQLVPDVARAFASDSTSRDTGLHVNSSSRGACKRVAVSHNNSSLQSIGKSTDESSAEHVSWLPRLVDSIPSPATSASAPPVGGGFSWVDQKQRLDQILSSISQSVTSTDLTSQDQAVPLKQQTSRFGALTRAVTSGGQAGDSPSSLASPAPLAKSPLANQAASTSTSSRPADSSSVPAAGWESDGDEDMIAFFQSQGMEGSKWADATGIPDQHQQQQAAPRPGASDSPDMSISREIRDQAVELEKLLAAVAVPAPSALLPNAAAAAAPLSAAPESPAMAASDDLQRLRPDQLLEEFACAPGRILFGYNPSNDAARSAAAWGAMDISTFVSSIPGFSDPLMEVLDGSDGLLMLLCNGSIIA